MNIEQQLSNAIRHTLKENFRLDFPMEEIVLQPTRKEFEGSHTFVTFKVAKSLGLNPEEVGKQLGTYLQSNTSLVKGYQAIKGFLNLSLFDHVWVRQLTDIGSGLQDRITVTNPQKLVIEFSQPNTNKPLHLGHLRNNSLGHSLAEILKAVGHEVYKVNIINDRGIHITKSMIAYEKFGQGETPQSSRMKGDHLVGKYYVLFDKEYRKQLKEILPQYKDEEKAKKNVPILLEAQELLRKWEAGDPIVRALWEKMNGWVFEGLDVTYRMTGITFDKIYYESSTYLLGRQVVEEGLRQDTFYKKDDGSVWIDLEEVGLDKKLLLRGDGTSVYITQDMGTADLRYEDYEFDSMIYVVGNEQDYHFKVLFEVMKRLGRTYADKLYHLSYGMVELPNGKMKSREGTVIDADTLIETMCTTVEQHTKVLGKVTGISPKEAKSLYQTLALGALKYYLLRVEPKKTILFDPEASIDFQGDTGTFIQYTYARIISVSQKAKLMGIHNDQLTIEQIEKLLPLELEVIILLNRFPSKLLEAADNYSPAVIAHYVLELAKQYNRLYAELSILFEKDITKRQLRILLSHAVAIIIKKCMKLLGIEVPHKM